MILDKQLLVSDQQLITATTVSTNAIDTGALNGGVIRNIGWGEHTRMMAAITQTFVGGTSIQAEQICADDSALSVNVTSMMLGPVVPVANAVQGGPLLLDASTAVNSRRFVGLRFNVVGGPFTAGAVTAGIVHDTDRQRQYPSGYPDAY